MLPFHNKTPWFLDGELSLQQANKINIFLFSKINISSSDGKDRDPANCI